MSKPMATCTERHHPDHTHQHGPNCGHTAVRHRDMSIICTMVICITCMKIIIDEHVIEVSDTNPVRCTLETRCPHTHGRLRTRTGAAR